MNASRIACQIRPTSVFIFDENFELSPNVGCKETLKQNLNSSVDEDLSLLNEQNDVLDVNFWGQSYLDKYEIKKLEYKQYYQRTLKDLGTFSKSQSKQITKCIELLTYSVYQNYDYKKSFDNQPRIGFLTLTLPTRQVHHDRLIRRCLSKFLDKLRRKDMLRNYVWNAETQKNGNIHFHLIIDRYIDKALLRCMWNNELSKLGYIANFELKYGHRYPSTTQIESLKNKKNIASYLIGYMKGKKKQKEVLSRRRVVGAIWGASNELKSLSYPRVYNMNEVERITSLMEEVVIPEAKVGFFIGNTFKLLRKSKIIYEKIRSYYRKVHLYLQGMVDIKNHYDYYFYRKYTGFKFVNQVAFYPEKIYENLQKNTQNYVQGYLTFT